MIKKSETYKAAQEKLKAAKEESKKLMQDAFKEGAAALFEQFPGLQAFRWKQYTPHFNDGDTCEFGVYVDCDVKPVGGEDFEDADEVSCDYHYRPTETDKFPKKKPEEMHTLHAAQAEATKLVAAFDEDDMKAAFGDHVQVAMDRDDGISVDEYDHD